MPLLWLGQVINTTGLMMLVPIMPFYVEQLGITGTVAASSWAGVAIAAPALVLTVATPLWGRVGDRIGRKWMVVRALLGLAIAMLVMATATSPTMLVIGRLLQGALGGVVEAATAFAGTTGPGGRRGSALGKSFSATATGSLLGPLAGGALIGTDALAVFMVAVGGLAVLAAAACALGLHEPRPDTDAPDTAPPDAAPVDSEADRDAETDDDVRGSGIGAGTVLRSGTTPARRPAAPYRWRTLPGIVSLAAAATASYLGIYGLIPIFAERVQTLEPAHAGLWVGVLQSLTWGATLLAAPWWGRRNDRHGRPGTTLAIAAAGCAVSLLGQALVTDPAGLIPLRLLQGACFAALGQSLFLHASNHAPPTHRSSAVGTANSFVLAGQSAGPLLAGPLLALVSVPTAIGMMAAACATGMILARTAAPK